MTADNNSVEFELLCLSIRLDDPVSARLSAQSLIESTKVDWQALWEQASWHRIRPQLGALLTSIPAESIPASFKSRITSARKQNAARQLANAQMFLRLNRAVDPIPIVPFKGFWMAHRYYDHLEDRESEDLDLFIYPEDISLIKEVFNGAGLHPMQGYPQGTDLEILHQFGEYNFDQFDGDIRTYHVECHGSLGAPIHRLGIRLSDLEDQLTREGFAGHQVVVFRPSALLLLTALHHGGKDAWEELRQVLDIGLFMQKGKAELDWAWIMKMVRQYDAENVFFTGIALASSLTDLILPDVAKKHISSAKVIRLMQNRMHFLSMPATYWNSFRVYGQRWLFHFSAKPGLLKKVRWTWEYFVEAGFRPGAGDPRDSSTGWLPRWMGFFKHFIHRIIRIARMEMKQRNR